MLKKERLAEKMANRYPARMSHCMRKCSTKLDCKEKESFTRFIPRYVTAIDPAAVKRAVKKIMEVIQQGVEVPEGQNDLRRNQLRELALLNGTLREGDVPRCTNCGATDHKAWQCQDKANVTNNVVCTSCGGVSRDI